MISQFDPSAPVIIDDKELDKNIGPVNGQYLAGQSIWSISGQQWPVFITECPVVSNGQYSLINVHWFINGQPLSGNHQFLFSWSFCSLVISCNHLLSIWAISGQYWSVSILYCPIGLYVVTSVFIRDRSVGSCVVSINQYLLVTVHMVYRWRERVRILGSNTVRYYY